MILPPDIHNKLVAKRERFLAWHDEYHHEGQIYRAALQRLTEQPPEIICELLADHDSPGALPSVETWAEGFCQPFAHRWTNHQQARAWAHDILLDHTTLAADGSQIQPVSDFSIPVAAVQVAWFVNHHTRAGSYEKNIELEVLAPDELQIEFNGEAVISEQAVNMRRFELEINTLCRLMQRLAQDRRSGQKTPLALFDSSLVISFADRLQEPQRAHYVELVLRLLRCSEKTGVPLIGYVDTSAARDLVRMLAHCFDLPEARSLHDAQLVGEILEWGDRTPLFICARGSADKKLSGVLDSFAEYRRGLGFVYLKTHSTAPPARLDIPLWVYERGLLDEVLDLVRAEVVVGNGYPYVIETADAAAVITARDREAFYMLFREFAAAQGIELRLSQKAVSKARRR